MDEVTWFLPGRNRESIIFDEFTKAVSKKRKCARKRCRRKIDFVNFIRVNLDRKTNDLSKIWNSDNVELFCCVCLKKEMKKARK